jgi:hypothetical protein
MGRGEFYCCIETLALRARSEFNGFAGKDRELFWSTGVLEHWSVGKSESPNFNLDWSFHYSTTPSIQQTAARGERAFKPPQGAAQSLVLGARVFFVGQLAFERSNGVKKN